MQLVYKITNKINNKFYIGRTKNFKERKRNHIRLLTNNKHHCIHLQNAWNKYGEENFLFEQFKIFNTGLDHDDLYLVKSLEQHFLDSYMISEHLYNTSKNTENFYLIGKEHPNFKSHPKEWVGEEGYLKLQQHYQRDFSGENNSFYGKAHSDETKEILRVKCPNYGEKNGFYGRTHTDESKKLMSEKAKLKTGDKNSFFGKTHSDESRDKISRGNKGKIKGIPKSEEHRRKMSLNNSQSIGISIDGVKYRSFNEAARILGIGRKVVSKRVHSDDPMYSNYIIIK